MPEGYQVRLNRAVPTSVFNALLGSVPRGGLLNDFARPAIAVRPKRALRTDLAVGIVDSFLVRTADDAVGHDDGLGTVLADEAKNRFSDGWVSSHIEIVGEPTFERVGFGVLRGNDADGDLAREFIAWAVERDRGDWVAAETSASLLLERGACPTLEFLHHTNLVARHAAQRIGC
jgi:hypothetical protein